MDEKDIAEASDKLCMAMDDCEKKDSEIRELKNRVMELQEKQRKLARTNDSHGSEIEDESFRDISPRKMFTSMHENGRGARENEKPSYEDEKKYGKRLTEEAKTTLDDKTGVTKKCNIKSILKRNISYGGPKKKVRFKIDESESEYDETPQNTEEEPGEEVVEVNDNEDKASAEEKWKKLEELLSGNTPKLVLKGENFLMLPRSFYLEATEEQDQVHFFVRTFNSVRFADVSLYERIKSLQFYPPLCTYSFDDVIQVMRQSNLGTSRRELSTLVTHYFIWYNFSADEIIKLRKRSNIGTASL
ncbi:unnamed protein product [Oikopleura dioica]|uniref:Uncharacterized protein n=1 Tax=Oikopleura dioica TaxID=34765 RepID=E4X0N2_OIKDI|nr:unnamed protein product [Oikopleura dioica]